MLSINETISSCVRKYENWQPVQTILNWTKRVSRSPFKLNSTNEANEPSSPRKLILNKCQQKAEHKNQIPKRARSRLCRPPRVAFPLNPRGLAVTDSMLSKMVPGLTCTHTHTQSELRETVAENTNKKSLAKSHFKRNWLFVCRKGKKQENCQTKENFQDSSRANDIKLYQKTERPWISKQRGKHTTVWAPKYVHLKINWVEERNVGSWRNEIRIRGSLNTAGWGAKTADRRVPGIRGLALDWNMFQEESWYVFS